MRQDVCSELWVACGDSSIHRKSKGANENAAQDDMDKEGPVRQYVRLIRLRWQPKGEATMAWASPAAKGQSCTRGHVDDGRGGRGGGVELQVRYACMGGRGADATMKQNLTHL